MFGLLDLTFCLSALHVYEQRALSHNVWAAPKRGVLGFFFVQGGMPSQEEQQAKEEKQRWGAIFAGVQQKRLTAEVASSLDHSAAS